MDAIGMSKDQFIERYGDVLVRFYRHYKHEFVFVGVNKLGDLVKVTVGGDADDVYRLEIRADLDYPIKLIEPVAGEVSINGEVVSYFDDRY